MPPAAPVVALMEPWPSRAGPPGEWWAGAAFACRVPKVRSEEGPIAAVGQRGMRFESLGAPLRIPLNDLCVREAHARSLGLTRRCGKRVMRDCACSLLERITLFVWP